MKKTHKIAFGVALVVIILNVVCLFGVIWLGITFLERTDETRGLQLPATEASDTQDIYLTPVTLYHYAEDAVEFVEKNREGLSETESVQPVSYTHLLISANALGGKLPKTEFQTLILKTP